MFAGSSNTDGIRRSQRVAQRDSGRFVAVTAEERGVERARHAAVERRRRVASSTAIRDAERSRSGLRHEL